MNMQKFASLSPIDRREFMQVSAGSLALAVAACRHSEDRTSLDNAKVTVLFEGDEWLLSPRYDVPAKFLMFLPLLGQNLQGENEGRLAQSWEHSPDYRTWTFHLRRDVKWHDGVPVTAHDIKFSLELKAHPDVLSGDVVSDMQSITVLDEFSLTIAHQKPRPLADWHWEDYYPKHLLSELDPKKFWSWEFWTRPVGNGPYRYLRHVPKTMMELEANPDHYRGKPRIDRVVLKFGGSNPLAELLSGNVDVLTYVNRADIAKLAGNPGFGVYHEMYHGWLEAIYWNHKHTLFRSPEVRRALTLAIDRRELAQLVNLPDDVPIFDVIFTRRQFRRRALPDPLPYDPEQAKRLLAAAGWRDQDGDGIRERAGVNAKFTAIVAEGTVLEPAAVYVQEQLRKVGVRMDVRSLESKMVLEKLESWGSGGEFDAAFSRFFNTASGHVWAFGKQSRIGYHNDKLFTLLQAAAGNLEPDAQDRIYSDVMKIFRDEVPMTFLFPQVRTFVAHRRLRGLSSDRPDPLWFMEYLWLEDGSRQ